MRTCALAAGAFACTLSVGLALPVLALVQQAHYGRDGPAVLPDTKVSSGDNFSGLTKGLWALDVTAGRGNVLASIQVDVYFQLPEGQDVSSD